MIVDGLLLKKVEEYGVLKLTEKEKILSKIKNHFYFQLIEIFQMKLYQ